MDNDNIREDLEERVIYMPLSMAYVETKNREVWKNIIRDLIGSNLMEEKKEEEEVFISIFCLIKSIVSGRNIATH